MVGFARHIALMKTIVVKILTRAATHNPQNRVVESALKHMGYEGISAVRVERCIVLEVAPEADTNQISGRIGDDLKKPAFARFFNPITDTFNVEIR